MMSCRPGDGVENSGSRVSRKTKHRTCDGFRPVCERPAGRGSRVRELRRLYATDENVSKKEYFIKNDPLLTHDEEHHFDNSVTRTLPEGLSVRSS